MIHKLRPYKRHIRQVLPVLVGLFMVGTFSFLGVHYYNSSKAATPGSIYISPSSGTYAPGSTLSIKVREDSGTTSVDTVQFTLRYNINQLQYLNLSEGGSFDYPGNTNTSQAGVIQAFRGMQTRSSSISGDHVVVTLNFKVLANSGSTAVTIDKPPISFMAKGGQPVTQAVVGGTYTVAAPPQAPTKDASLSFAPSSGSFAPGSQFTVAVHIKSPTQKVYTVEPIITYPADKLQYVDTTNSPAFPSASRTQDTPGTLDLIRGLGAGRPGFTGEDLIASVTFKVIGTPGNISLGFKTGSKVDTVDARANVTDILGSAPTASFAISATPTPPPPVTLDNGGNTTSTSPVSTAAVTIKAPASGGHVTVSGGAAQLQGTVELSPVIDPVVFTTNPDDSIRKVEYYLNGKRVATLSSAPWVYKFDTKKLKNGAYEITIKTDYVSGASSNNKSSMVIDNPINVAYVTGHYTGGVLTTLGLLVVSVFFIWKYVRPRFSRDLASESATGYGGYIGRAGANVNSAGALRYENPVVTPINTMAVNPALTSVQPVAAPPFPTSPPQQAPSPEPTKPSGPARPPTTPTPGPV